jgi:hypothetical protein
MLCVAMICSSSSSITGAACSCRRRLRSRATAEVGAQQRGVVGPVDAAQPERGTALVRAHDRIDVRSVRHGEGGGTLGWRVAIGLSPFASLT